MPTESAGLTVTESPAPVTAVTTGAEGTEVGACEGDDSGAIGIGSGEARCDVLSLFGTGEVFPFRRRLIAGGGFLIDPLVLESSITKSLAYQTGLPLTQPYNLIR